MPLGGGVGIHNDVKHFGSAKRNAYGGVVPYGDFGEIFGAANDYSGFITGMLANLQGTLSITPGITHGDAMIGVNAVYQSGVWNRFDISAPATLFSIHADLGIITMETAPAGANPIAWTDKAVLAPQIGVQSDDLSQMVMTPETEIITVAAGTVVGNSPSNLWVVDKFMMGLAYEVIESPTNLPNMDVGLPSDPDRFAAAVSGGLGTVGNSMDGSATVSDPVTPAASEVVRVTLTLAVPAGEQARIRVTAYRYEMVNASLGP